MAHNKSHEGCSDASFVASAVEACAWILGADVYVSAGHVVRVQRRHPAGHQFLSVATVADYRLPELSHLVYARRFSSLGPGLLEHRNEHRRQDHDYPDYDQQLDQRERSVADGLVEI